MISSIFRFHGHGSLRYVYTNGAAVRSQFATIKFVVNSRRKHSRISVVVSKKIIKRAIGRNRIRRRVYEYIRTHLEELNSIYDIVIIVTSAELKDISSNDLTEQFDQMFIKAGLYKTPEN